MSDTAADLEYFEPIGTTAGSHRPDVDPFEILGFELLVLTAGETRQVRAEGRELAVVSLTGIVDVSVGEEVFEAVGGRTRVFDGPPDTVYAPTGASVTVTATTDAEVAICSAKTDDAAAGEEEPYRVRPDEVFQGTWGSGNTTRTYDFVINGERPSRRLYVAEVTVRDGRWATFPPHKHETGGAVENEIFQEEYYFYRVDPEQGFGFAGLYGGQVGAEKAFVIRNNTLHKIPHGYHTLSAAPGYSVWYLAAYAGRAKEHRPFTDPSHQWLTEGYAAPAAVKPE